MASRGSSGGASCNERKESLICSLCLEVFKNPKFLPCHHTLCLQCLVKLVESHQSRSFPCPQCRHEVNVPPGGVSTFRNNFYLHEEDLDRAEKGAVCSVHPSKDLDIYCEDCQQPVCATCFLDEHRQHNFMKIQEAADLASEQLKDDEKLLEEVVSRMFIHLDAEKAELKSAEDKMAAVEKAIRRKHAWLTSLVDKCRDDAMASLATVSGRHDDDLSTKEDGLDQLLQLQKRLQQAVSSGACVPLLAVSKEMMGKYEDLLAMSEMASQERPFVLRPVLNSEVKNGVFTTLFRDFFGAVDDVEVKVKLTPPEIKVEEQFRFGEEREDIEVFSLCPGVNGKHVLVSFALRGLQENAPSEEFDEKGKHVCTHEKATGKRSWKSRGGGNPIYATVATGQFNTFDKSLKKKIFQLSNRVSAGIAYVQTVTAKSEDPNKRSASTLFPIHVEANHRAFAVDHSEMHFVVLEETSAASKDTRRKVRLYNPFQRNTVATYEPPSAACQPSDVCFWRGPGGRTILVVADEGTDSLHVVDVENGEFTFKGYLAHGSSLIVQPTALNTDTRGRLWVAMRGGQIVTLTVIAPVLLKGPQD